MCFGYTFKVPNTSAERFDCEIQWSYGSRHGTNMLKLHLIRSYNSLLEKTYMVCVFCVALGEGDQA